MQDKNIINDFNHIFPKYISEEFLFSIDSYLLFLDRLSLDPLFFINNWTFSNRKSIVEKYWKSNTNLDWKWSVSFPLFSLLEKYVENFDNPKIIGLSGLPGSGKSTLGFWIDSVSRDLNLDIKVISLDDFYLPAKEMDIAMNGNPWNVPRGFPGSHSMELLDQSLEDYLNTGVLNSPTFDKSLRGGRGDRSGWCESKPKILILEGWFVGCQPISNLNEIDYVFEDKLNLCLSQIEKEFRRSIQLSLVKYREIWKKFDKIWNLKSTSFNNTILWKRQQESEMIKLKGAGLKDNKLNDFIRMIQTSIPQQAISLINSDTTIEINQDRRIEKLITNIYNFN